MDPVLSFTRPDQVRATVWHLRPYGHWVKSICAYWSSFILIVHSCHLHSSHRSEAEQNLKIINQSVRACCVYHNPKRERGNCSRSLTFRVVINQSLARMTLCSQLRKRNKHQFQLKAQSHFEIIPFFQSIVSHDSSYRAKLRRRPAHATDETW